MIKPALRNAQDRRSIRLMINASDRAFAQMGSSMIIVIMGPAGAGKTTLAEHLAPRLEWPFIEGDQFHPPANIEKMRSGLPLDDEDRRTWLAALARQIMTWRASGVSGVLTCSALKRAYRDALRSGDPELVFAYLDADAALLTERVSNRKGHFMPAGLIASQLETLERPDPDERVIMLDAHDRVESQAETVAARIAPARPRAGE